MSIQFKHTIEDRRIFSNVPNRILVSRISNTRHSIGIYRADGTIDADLLRLAEAEAEEALKKEIGILPPPEVSRVSSWRPVTEESPTQEQLNSHILVCDRFRGEVFKDHPMHPMRLGWLYWHPIEPIPDGREVKFEEWLKSQPGSDFLLIHDRLKSAWLAAWEAEKK